MKRQLKQLLCGFLAATALSSGAPALGLSVTPDSPQVVVPQDGTTAVFDMILDSERDFAAVQIMLSPSQADVQLSVEEGGLGGSFVSTVKDGVLIFGYYSGNENSFPRGKHKLATITCHYSGSEERTVEMLEANMGCFGQGILEKIDLDVSDISLKIVKEGHDPSPRPTDQPSPAPEPTDSPVPSPGQKPENGKPSAGKGDVEIRTVENPDGSVSTLIRDQNGSDSETRVEKNGRTEARVKLSEQTILNAGGRVVPLPMGCLTVAPSDSAASVVTVEMSRASTVMIPVEGAGSSTVAYLVEKNGTRKLLRKTWVDQAGLIVALNGSSKLEIAENEKNYCDVSAHWANHAIRFVSARELFQGVSATEFAPDAAMSRAMLTTVLWRLEDSPEAKTGTSFRDVPANRWYTDPISWAAGEKIVTGYGDRFAPDDSITRQQLATMMFRYAAGKGLSTEANRTLEGFRDRDQVAGWASDAMQWAVSVGLIGGRGNAQLDPTGTATRAEVAAICQRMVGLLSAHGT